MKELFFLFCRSWRTWDKVRIGWILVFGLCVYSLILSEYNAITAFIKVLFTTYPEHFIYKGVTAFLLSDFILKFILFKKAPLHKPVYLHTKPLRPSAWIGFSLIYEGLHPLNIYFLLFIPFLVPVLGFSGSLLAIILFWCASLLGSAVCGIIQQLTDFRPTRIYGIFLFIGYLSFLFIAFQWLRIPLGGIMGIIFTGGLLFTFVSIRYNSSPSKVTAKGGYEKGFEISNLSFFRMEMISVIRNKRLRQGLFYTMLFMTIYFYWISYRIIPENEAKKEILIYLLIFYIFLPGGTLAQFIWGAESNFFPLLATRPFPFFQWIRSKYNFYCILSCIALLVITPLLYRTGMDIWDILSLFLYGAGMNIFLLFPLLFNRVRLSLGKSSFFNYEGFDMVTTIYFIIVVCGATYLYFFIRKNMDDLWYMLVTAGIGIVLFSGRNLFFRFLERNIQKNKYNLLETFRKAR